MILFYIYFFLLGLCIGSFLNVVIYRYNTGMSLNGRSQCFSCSKTLKWYELIPVFSFLFNKARCRGCGSAISWQYIVVEILTGFLFVALFCLDGFSYLLLLDLFIWSLFIVVLVYDIRHKIIPDLFVLILIILGYIRTLSLLPVQEILTLSTLWLIISSSFLFIPFWLLWYFSKGKWIGLGDGKLAIAIGALVGLNSGSTALVFAVWSGTLIMLTYLLIQKLLFLSNKLTIKSEIPFAPFMILGLWIVFYYRVGLIDVLVFVNRIISNGINF